jgi:hypothetical protein
MQTYYFPTLLLYTEIGEDLEIDSEKYKIIRRAWDTSIFDLATLATRHKLHLPYQVMDVLLRSCNCEIAVKNAATPDEAIKLFNHLRLGLYISGASPFCSPFLATESINSYSGINSRDTSIARGETPKIPRACHQLGGLTLVANNAQSIK